MKTENQNLSKSSIVMVRIAAALFLLSSFVKWVKIGSHDEGIQLGGFASFFKDNGNKQSVFPFLEVFLIFWAVVLFMVSKSSKKATDYFIVICSIIGLLAMGIAGFYTNAVGADDDVYSKLYPGFYIAALGLFMSILAFVKRREA